MTITTPAKIARGAAKCNATKAIVKVALEAQIAELEKNLAGYIARDVADEMTDNRYYSNGSRAAAVKRIDNTKAEIALLKAALGEVFSG